MYLILSPYVGDGKYRVSGKLKWHMKLRLNLCKRLYLSVRKPYLMEVKTTASSGASTFYKQWR